ncbi:MAG: polyprenyl synthetase family protein [Gammaproteobacteria bacterium]|nr:polyprenyl synthetase family protein [Gammaproteobacteria bacterium]
MKLVDGHIRDCLRSEVVLINQVANYIISGGGKRLRPMLLILSARGCNYTGQQHVPLAAIIEFIHTATLLHDDVVDESDFRRGRETAHAVWGNAASVLVGDFLYSRSFQMMVGVDSMRVMDIMSEATNTIAEGEVLQLLNLGDPEITEEAYFRVIRNKTAKLFEAACRLGGVIAGCDEPTEQALARFGNCLGMAFQVADDVLDYDGDGTTMGKNVGDDLAEGKPTLPLIHARNRAASADRALIDRAIREGGTENMLGVIRVVHESGALESAMQSAQALADEAGQAIADLPESLWSRAMAQLAGYAYQRES